MYFPDQRGENWHGFLLKRLILYRTLLRLLALNKLKRQIFVKFWCPGPEKAPLGQKETGQVGVRLWEKPMDVDVEITQVQILLCPLRLTWPLTT